MATLQDIIAKLNDEQKLLLADTIVFGGWGDTDGEFDVDFRTLVIDRFYRAVE